MFGDWFWWWLGLFGVGVAVWKVVVGEREKNFKFYKFIIIFTKNWIDPPSCCSISILQNLMPLQNTDSKRFFRTRTVSFVCSTNAPYNFRYHSRIMSFCYRSFFDSNILLCQVFLYIGPRPSGLTRSTYMCCNPWVATTHRRITSMCSASSSLV